MIPVETGQHRIDRDDLDDPGYGERRYVVGERILIRRGEEQWWRITYADGNESEAPESWIRRDPIESEAL